MPKKYSGIAVEASMQASNKGGRSAWVIRLGKWNAFSKWHAIRNAAVTFSTFSRRLPSVMQVTDAMHSTQVILIRRSLHLWSQEALHSFITAIDRWVKESSHGETQQETSSQRSCAQLAFYQFMSRPLYYGLSRELFPGTPLITISL